jgi:uncharacterized membrane protein
MGENVGAFEIGMIVAGVVLVVGFIVWRVWMGRTRKGEQHENPD